MKKSESDSFLLNFSAALKDRGRLPKNIEVSTLQSATMASIFNESQAGIISETVFCGMDPDPATAILKGLVEMVERQAFTEGFRSGLPSCQTDRSDGFAAFPVGITSKEPQNLARENALSEAIERFAWATWWDNPQITFSKTQTDLENLSLGESLLWDLQDALEIETIYEIQPKIAGDHTVIIYFAFLNPLGVISGGACGKRNSVETVKFRALSELLRHGLAIHKLKDSTMRPQSFYEKRLAFFGLSEEGTQLAWDRLNQTGSQTITLPSLSIDHEVPHSLSDLVKVHRCYFDNQPDFVGGKLERLCL